MLIGERRQKIVEMVDKNGSMTVEKLSNIFKVSKITIRADLKTLENSGRLVRTHGGALKLTDEVYDLPLAVKETKYREEKFLIGNAAVDLIQDRETIILDSGSTTMEIAKKIGGKSFSSLTVITNALNIAMELAHKPNIQIVMLGGTLRNMSYSMVGPLAEEILVQFNADRLFLGVDGFDITYGLSTPDILEARLNKRMIDVSEKIILVSDSSKFGRRSMSFIASPDLVDLVITDSNISSEYLEEFKKKNIEVITVSVKNTTVPDNKNFQFNGKKNI